MNSARQIGKAGEDLAAAYLEKSGYTIVERNFYTKYGELDIIAQDGEILAIVEVKTRKDSSFSEAASNVTHAKRRKIRNTALYWYTLKKLDCPVRFDVIEVYSNDKINHIIDAFQ